MTESSVPPTHKPCSKCKQSKPLGAFKRRTESPSTYQSWCRACTNAYQHDRYVKNKKAINAHRVTLRQMNPEKSQQYAHQWYLRNIDKVAKQSKAYKNAHPDKVTAWQNKRRATLQLALINDLTSQDWQDIKVAFKFCCAYCGRKLQRLTQDHITPLSKGGNHTKSNVVPACQSCNSRKNSGPPRKPVQPLLL